MYRACWAATFVCALLLMSFSISDTRIYIGYSAAAALTAALIIDGSGSIALCMMAAALHELGHLIMMRCFCVKITGISLRLFDARIEAAPASSFTADICIALGGPVMNLVLAGCSFFLSRVFCYANLALGIFNLMPIMSLDGGRVLYLVLSRRFSPRTCAAVLKFTSFVILLPLLTAGITILFRSGYNYSLLAVSLYLLAILVLK